MRKALTGLFLLATSTLAYAADAESEARLSWQLSFGGEQAVRSGYAMTFGYREYEDLAPAGPMLTLAELAMSEEAAVARLAGVPVYGGPRAAGQVEGDIAYSSSPAYWVWWVATGAVIAVVAIDKADSDDTPAPAGTGGG